MPLRGISGTRLGVDIALVSRFSSYVEHGNKPLLDRWLRKCFTPREVQAFRNGSGSRRELAKFLASRWSMKEAVIKCLQKNKPVMREIEIYQRSNGSPFALVYDSPPWVEDNSGAGDGEQRSNRLDDVVVGASIADVEGSKRADFLRLRSDPRKLEGEDALFVDLSLSHDGDYCVAVAQSAVDADAGWRWKPGTAKPTQGDGKRDGDVADGM